MPPAITLVSRAGPISWFVGGSLQFDEDLQCSHVLTVPEQWTVSTETISHRHRAVTGIHLSSNARKPSCVTKRRYTRLKAKKHRPADRPMDEPTHPLLESLHDKKGLHCEGPGGPSLHPCWQLPIPLSPASVAEVFSKFPKFRSLNRNCGVGGVHHAGTYMW